MHHKPQEQILSALHVISTLSNHRVSEEKLMRGGSTCVAAILAANIMSKVMQRVFGCIETKSGDPPENRSFLLHLNEARLFRPLWSELQQLEQKR